MTLDSDDETATKVIEVTGRIYEQVVKAGVDALEAEPLMRTLCAQDRALAWLIVMSRANVAAQFIAQGQGVAPEDIVRWVHMGAQLGVEIQKAMQSKPTKAEKLQ